MIKHGRTKNVMFSILEKKKLVTREIIVICMLYTRFIVS
jgi:hypothetical protein